MSDHQQGGDDKDKYHPSSFLYIRYNLVDLGARPTVGDNWQSPDLNVLPMTGGAAAAETTEIVAGRKYRIECKVHNGGDLDAYAVTVDFFLCNPTLGARVSLCKPLGLVSISVTAHSFNIAYLEWIASSDDVGHRCLFARAYSFSPADLPLDFDQLNVYEDRHIAQQNLNVISAINFLSFNITPMKMDKGEFAFTIRPAGEHAMKEIAANPVLRKLKLVKGNANSEFKVTSESNKNLKLRRGKGRIWQGETKKPTEIFSVDLSGIQVKKNEAQAYEVIQVGKDQNEIRSGISIIVTNPKLGLD